MSAPPEQELGNPEHTQVHFDEDPFYLEHAGNLSTTIGRVQHEIDLEEAEQTLGFTRAEWLRLQQEISNFLKDMKEFDKTNEEAALAFLNDTGAKNRFFGLLAGGGVEGMLESRTMLTWGLDNDRIVRHIAAIIAAWKPFLFSNEGSKGQVKAKSTAEDFSNDEQIFTMRRINPRVMSMLPAGIAKSCGVTAAEDEGDSAHDQNIQHQQSHGSATDPRTSSQVQTASAPRHDPAGQTTFLPNRPSSFTLDVWPSDAEHTGIPVPTASKPWLKVCLYVDGEKTGRGHKLIMVEPNMSLATFKAQVFNAYYWQLDATRRNLHKDSVRFYIVHYGTKVRGGVVRLEADDDRAWSAALDRLQRVARPADEVVLKGYVDAHF